MPQAPQIQLVALPLGNPKDLSRRAGDSLETADWIFCEDTRKLKALMEACQLKLKEGVRLSSIPGGEEWNFNWSALEEVTRSQPEYRVVLCSDAGTPSINDPGRALLIEAHKRKWPVIAVPGPSAPVMAIQWSGGFGLPMVFFGFAPKGSGKHFEEFVLRLRGAKSFVFFDTRYNIQSTLELLEQASLGSKNAFLAREMTKTHEELWEGTVSEIKKLVDRQLREEDAIGEITMVIEGEMEMPASTLVPSTEGAETLARKILSLSNLAPKAASKLLAELSGLSKNDAYKFLVEFKKEVK